MDSFGSLAWFCPQLALQKQGMFLSKGVATGLGSLGTPHCKANPGSPQGGASLSPQILLSTKAKLGNRPYFPNSDFVELLCKHVPCSKARWPEQCAAHRQEASWARQQQLKGPSGVWPGAVVGVGRSKGTADNRRHPGILALSLHRRQGTYPDNRMFGWLRLRSRE